jgi:hypothetical protein
VRLVAPLPSEMKDERDELIAEALRVESSLYHKTNAEIVEDESSQSLREQKEKGLNSAFIQVLELV